MFLDITQHERLENIKFNANKGSTTYNIFRLNVLFELVELA